MLRPEYRFFIFVLSIQLLPFHEMNTFEKDQCIYSFTFYFIFITILRAIAENSNNKHVFLFNFIESMVTITRKTAPHLQRSLKRL